jgi:hypothetical protein
MLARSGGSSASSTPAAFRQDCSPPRLSRFILRNLSLQLMRAMLIVVCAASWATAHASYGFQSRLLETSTSRRRNRWDVVNPPIFRFNSAATSTVIPHRPRLVTSCPKTSSTLDMVRNIDLPEAIVFYGLESLMQPPLVEEIDAGDVRKVAFSLRPGVKRLLNECKEVGTASLLLSEDADEEDGLKLIIQEAWERAEGPRDKKLMNGDNLANIHIRCLNYEFSLPPGNEVGGDIINDYADALDEYDVDTEFYHLGASGRSPSPAFLLDSLRSVRIDPRGFGGSSGFGRGQWIEPRRSPMPARTVVFIAGDWSPSPKRKDDKICEEGGKINNSIVRDRCAGARAAGCRVVYLEQITKEQGFVAIQDDAPTMSLCDAVIGSYGNDNPRDLLQPITLDAISTPGNYWLNPPTPRDDVGNTVAVDELVDWFRSERVLRDVVGNSVAISEGENVSVGEEMSEEEMKSILADLNDP